MLKLLFLFFIYSTFCFDVSLDLRGHEPVTYKPLHRNIDLDVGSYFTVILDENGSTGYSWQVVDTYMVRGGVYSVLMLVDS
jgi:hypothetical protein